MTSQPKKAEYFNLQKIIDRYNIPWQTGCLLCINAIRNVGKTTNGMEWVMPKVTFKSKIAFIRNSEEQIKTFKQDFNARFAGRFMIVGIMVWSLRQEIEVDKEGNENVRFVKDCHVGYCGGISTYTKIKSIEAANIKFIFFDEYNEDHLAIKNVYVKWINMVKTLSRFSNVFILMLGNRDTPNNEFMVKWGVLPSQDEFYEDYFVKFSERGFFLEMGSRQFDGLENDKTLANELAQFDNDTKRYLEGGYAAKMSLQVVPWGKIISRTFDPLWKAAIDGEICVFGEFKHELTGQTVWALVHDEEAVKRASDVQTFSLDSLSYQIKEARLNTQESIYGIIEKLFRLHKKHMLFYDSFDIMNAMINKMLIIKY